MFNNTTKGTPVTGSNAPTGTEAVNVIYSTTNYSLFKDQIGNRVKSKTHIENLKKSIGGKNLLNAQAIVINENFEIIDGQHRFEAAKSLNLPIFFYKVDKLGAEETRILNIGKKNWDANSFMNSYADLGDQNYIQYRNFFEANRDIIDHNVVQLILGGLGREVGSKSKFYSGEFKVVNYIKALETMKLIRELYNELVVIRGASERREAIYALLHMFDEKGYDNLRMKRKLQKHPKENMRFLRRRNDFISELVEIYNWNAGINERPGNLVARDIINRANK